MKQEAIQKINRMGKIGQIVSCILQVITIIGIIILLTGSFASSPSFFSSSFGLSDCSEGFLKIQDVL